jgi:hypothetical protein
MTDVEETYTKNLKYNAFMGTIGVCVIYAIIAIIMLLYINLTEQGKTLYSELKPFALTFIFGTLIIIITTTIMVLHWKPEQAKKLEINDVLQNPYSCPDYYILEKIADDSADKDIISNLSSKLDNNKKYILDSKVDLNNYTYNKKLEYKCVNDPNIIDTTTTIESINNTANTNFYTSTPDGVFTLADKVENIATKKAELDKIKSKEAYASFAMMYGGIDNTCNLKIVNNTIDTTKFKIDCSTVYPDYLAKIDAQYYIDHKESGLKNKHRCEWSKQCGVPWGSAGCS